jgi:hypothetical protein
VISVRGIFITMQASAMTTIFEFNCDEQKAALGWMWLGTGETPVEKFTRG